MPFLFNPLTGELNRSAAGGGGGGVSSINGQTGTVTLVAGTGISVTPAGGNITIAATGGGGSDSFKTIQPDNGTSPIATSPTDTLTLHNTDGNIVITGNSGTDTITFNLASGVGTPGGSSGQIQFNNSGAFGGFGSWDGTDVTVPNALTANVLIADASVQSSEIITSIISTNTGDLTLESDSNNVIVSGNLQVTGTSSLDNGAITTDGLGNLIINSLGSDMSAFGIGELGDAQFGTNSVGFSINPDSDGSSSRLIYSNSGSWQINGDGSASLGNLLAQNLSVPYETGTISLDGLFSGSSYYMTVFENQFYIDSAQGISLITGEYGVTTVNNTLDDQSGKATFVSLAVTGTTSLDNGNITTDGTGDLLLTGGITTNARAFMDGGFETNYFYDYLGNLAMDFTVANQITFYGGAFEFSAASGITGLAGLSLGSNGLQVEGSSSLDHGAINTDGSGNITAASYTSTATPGFIGDGSGLTGVVAAPGGSSGDVQWNNGGVLSGGGGITMDGTGGLFGSEWFITDGGVANFSGVVTSYVYGPGTEWAIFSNGSVSFDSNYIFSDGGGYLTVYSLPATGGPSSFDAGAITTSGSGNLTAHNFLVPTGGSIQDDGSGGIYINGVDNSPVQVDFLGELFVPNYIQIGTANAPGIIVFDAGNVGAGPTSAVFGFGPNSSDYIGAFFGDGSFSANNTVTWNAAGNVTANSFTAVGTPGFTGDGSGLTNLPNQTYAGTTTATGTATTTFTVTIGHTMANTNYSALTEGSNVLSSAIHYVNNKTTTTFDVVYLTGLTGSVAFDWTVTPYN
jgi:fibronectin-binding autotransporter adhesin